MKKNYFLAFLLITSFLTINAQILSEDFTNDVPSSGWTIDSHSTNWSQQNSNTAGGDAPEARLHWSPQFNGDSRLISPSMDLTGINNIIIDFKHTVDHYGSGYSVGVATRSNGGAWNNVWTRNGTGDITEGKSILVSNSDTSQADFQMCFYFSGSSFQINDWYIDSLTIFEAQSTDLSLSSNNTEDFLEAGSVTISCTAKNLGINPITSFDINYQVDGGSVITENISGVNITTTQSYNHTFASLWNSTPGTYNVTTSISNVNGNGNDDDTANDSYPKAISIATNSVTNTPLFESFTSSTCNPCNPFNQNIFNPFMSSHNDIAVVKYQMSWPAPGDIYYTDEGGSRRNYYGINAIPALVTGGGITATNSGAVNSNYNAETAKPSFFNLNATFTLAGSTVTVNTEITPYVTGTFTVHKAILEKNTTENTASNGESSFENVMMKMLPNGEGTQVSFTADTPYTISESFDMSSTNVEELSDLALVIFIQNDLNGTIMQSVYKSETTVLGTTDLIFETVSLYPNPSNGLLNIKTINELQISISDVLGKVVMTNQAINNDDTINLNSLDNGVYFVKINDGNLQGIKKIILEK